MRILVALVLVSLAGLLKIGYYEALEEGDVEKVFFIKRSLAFQVKFYNIHANDGEVRKVGDLTEEQRDKIIDYCKYRLGIETRLATQSDVELCRTK